jgi:hypothetical protein
LLSIGSRSEIAAPIATRSGPRNSATQLYDSASLVGVYFPERRFKGRVREGRVREGRVREGRVHEGRVHEGRVREGRVRD